MLSPLTLLSTCLLTAAGPVESRFVQVHPAPTKDAIERSAGQERALVLVHGFRQLLTAEGVAAAELRPWQRAGSVLVKTLGAEADVFAFAYGQDAPLEEVTTSSSLLKDLQRLRRAGYRRLILVGHSAGGLIARQLAEDHSDVGITKVIQVCAPNAGTSWGRLLWGVPQSQAAFLRSLTPEGRNLHVFRRAERKIPESVQFVCVVGVFNNTGDGLVQCHSQWPEDLQGQGIPAVSLHTSHFLVMRDAGCAARLAEVVRADQPRWDGARVARMRQQLPGLQAGPVVKALDSRKAYQATLLQRAAQARQDGDIQAQLECAFALFPLETAARAAPPEYARLLAHVADTILAAQDGAAAQHFLELSGPLLRYLPADKRQRVSDLALGKPPLEAARDPAGRARTTLRKVGRALVDPEAKTRGGSDRELAESLGLAVLTVARPTAVLMSETAPTLGRLRREFPGADRARLDLEMTWHSAVTDEDYTSRIRVTLLGHGPEVEVLDIQYSDNSPFPPPSIDRGVLAELNAGLPEP